MSADLQDLLRQTSPEPSRAPDTAALLREVRRRRGRRRSASLVAVVGTTLGVALATGSVGRPAPVAPTVGDPPPAIQLEPDHGPEPVDPLPTEDNEQIAASVDRSAGQPDPLGPATPDRRDPEPRQPVPSPPVAVPTTAPSSAPRSPSPAPTAAPRMTTSWTFDEGPDDWYDGGGNDHAGVFAGNASTNTRDTDPRYGWTHDDEGRTGPGAIRAWRTTGGDRASISSPWVELPDRTTAVRVSLWYRWHRQPADVIVVSLGTGRELERPVELARLTSGQAPLGVWRQVEVEVPSEVLHGLGALFLHVEARYDAPAADPDCGSADHSESCDLGFRFDDVSVRVW